MHRQKVEDKPGMGGAPRLDRLAMMDADVVADDMDGRDRSRDELVEMIEKAEAFHLPFAPELARVDLPRARIEGRKEVEGTAALILVVALDRTAGLGRSGGGEPMARLDGGPERPSSEPSRWARAGGCRGRQ